MNGRDAFARLRRLGVPVINTADAASALGQTTFAASKTLSRLAESSLIVAVRHGTWWLEGKVDPYRLPEYLSAPFASYLSLQTALQLHGLIEQIPEVFYVVSLGRSQRIDTKVGRFSCHHITPELFGGFLETAAGAMLATPEKALFDLAYLSGGRSRRFSSLPELELPRKFRRAELGRWLERIPSARSKTLTARKLDALLAKAKHGEA
jgi:predicted transcriptional regulator of viral defense system